MIMDVSGIMHLCLFSIVILSRVWRSLVREVRQDERQLLPSSLGLDLFISTFPSLKLWTHLFPGNTSESHRPLDLIQEFVLLNNIVNILHQSSGDSSGITSVGVESLDDFLDCYGGMAGSPGIIVGRSTDQSVATCKPNNLRE
jgi:hypothetical protein